MTNAHHHIKIHHAQPNNVQEVLQFFLPNCEFWHPRGLLGQKFIKHGNCVQHASIYQCAKFHPDLTICV